MREEYGSEGIQEIDLDPTTGGMGVARLYFGLLRQRFTGTIEWDQISPEPGPRRVWFRGGMPLFTDWISPAHVLGEILLARGSIEQPHLEAALLTMSRDGGLLGEALIAAGRLEPKMLSEALRIQCRHKLVETFALADGLCTVETVEHDLGQGDALCGQVNVLALILGGTTKHLDEERVRADMGPALDGDLVATPAFPRYRKQFGFRPEDASILDGLARGTRLSSLARPGVPARRALAVAYTLWACQMLRTGADASRAIAEDDGTRSRMAPPSAAGRTGSAAEPRGTSSPTPASGPGPRAATRTASTAASTASSTTSRPTTGASRTDPARPQTGAAASAPSTPPRAPPPTGAADRRPASSTTDAKNPARSVSTPSEPFEAELAALEARVSAGAHAFDLFKLPLDVERREIRARWAELSKRFHPDGLESIDRTDLRPRVEAVFAALSEAHGILSKAEKRAELKLVLEAGGSGRGDENAANIVRNALQAEMIAREADKLLKRSNFARAAQSYREAYRLSPQDFDVQAALLWCEFQLSVHSQGHLDTLIGGLEAVIEAQKKCARAHYYRGLAMLKMRNDRVALDSLKTAISLDPQMIDAQRQIHAIQARRRQDQQKDAPPKKGSGLSLKGLFKKKNR